MAIEEEAVVVLRLAAAVVAAEEVAPETPVVLVLKMLMHRLAVSEAEETPTTVAEETVLLLRRVRDLRLLLPRVVKRNATTEAEVPETTKVALVVLKVVLPTEVDKDRAVAREAADAPTMLASAPRSKKVAPVRVVPRVSRDVLPAVTVLAEVEPTVPRRTLRPRNELQRELFDLARQYPSKNRTDINMKQKAC